LLLMSLDNIQDDTRYIDKPSLSRMTKKAVSSTTVRKPRVTNQILSSIIITNEIISSSGPTGIKNYKRQSDARWKSYPGKVVRSAAQRLYGQY
jgi:hypothetical protein